MPKLPSGGKRRVKREGRREKKKKAKRTKVALGPTRREKTRRRVERNFQTPKCSWRAEQGTRGKQCSSTSQHQSQKEGKKEGEKGENGFVCRRDGSAKTAQDKVRGRVWCRLIISTHDLVVEQ